MNDISSSNKAADAAFSSTFSSAENAAARPAAAPAPQKPEVPAHFQQFLGFDFGIKRTGCASGNRVLGGARRGCAARRPGQAPQSGRCTTLCQSTPGSAS